MADAKMMSVLRFVLSFIAILPATQAFLRVYSPYITDVNCSSTEIPGGYSVQLTPQFTLHWQLLQTTTSTTQTPRLKAALVYQEQGWIGLGFSPSGQMIGSTAVIGSPMWAKPRLYQLKDKDAANSTGSVERLLPDADLTGHDIQMTDHTTMTFEIGLPSYDGNQQPDVAIIVAGGEDDNFPAYHKHRASFRIDLTQCGSNTITTPSTTTSSTNQADVSYDHKAAFLAHGIFATLAFAVVIPFAVGSARFRVLVPKNWIYIHVISNCFAFFFATVAVGVAFGGMVMRGKAGSASSGASHMTRAHHWIGLFLFLVVIFQVVSGFRRPPVEKIRTTTDNTKFVQEPRPKFCGIPLPQTSREKWNALHRITALVCLALALYQLQSGLKLYADEYAGGSRDGVIVFGVWVGFLILLFIVLSVVVCCKREPKEIRSRNIMPQREEEDEDDEGPETETNEFSYII